MLYPSDVLRGSVDTTTITHCKSGTNTHYSRPKYWRIIVDYAIASLNFISTVDFISFLTIPTIEASKLMAVRVYVSDIPYLLLQVCHRKDDDGGNCCWVSKPPRDSRLEDDENCARSDRPDMNR